MRFNLVALFASLCIASPVLAQATPPAPDTTAPAVSSPAATVPAAASAPAGPVTSAAPELTKDGKPKAKAVRAACRASAKSDGLKGAERQKAISACVIKQRPDLAAKEQCRMDAKAKGLAKGDERKAFIKDCVKAKG